MLRMAFAQDLPVIPVIDILGARVVRAERGWRSTYRAIVSPRVDGHAPGDVAAALLAQPACSSDPPVLYVADLDALQGGRVQGGVIAGLLQRFAALQLWLDGGFRTPGDVVALRAGLGPDGARVRPVFGSESLADLDALAAIGSDPAAILSLDSRAERPLDAAGCWRHPASWPATVIVMTLDRVGAAAGPDLARFGQLRAQAPGRRWIGAGGIRDRADLRAATAAGASAWLVATALHAGTLDP